MAADVEDLRERLAVISDELADLAMSSLRRSLDAGASRDPTERAITRARRSVDKAASILAQLETEALD